MKGTSHQLGTLHRNHFWCAMPRAIKKGSSESAKKVGDELISLSDGAFVPRPGVARARANVVFNSEIIFKEKGHAELTQSLIGVLREAPGSVGLKGLGQFSGCRVILKDGATQDEGDPFEDLYFHLSDDSRWTQPGGMAALSSWFSRVESHALACGLASVQGLQLTGRVRLRL